MAPPFCFSLQLASEGLDIITNIRASSDNPYQA